MSDSIRNPFQKGLARSGQARAHDAIQRLGKALPCSITAVNGQIVTVKFELSGVTLPKVTVPVAGSEYIRHPLQFGDKGVVFACDADIGHISGLGSDTPPDTTAPANLSALVFFPIGSKKWTAAANPDAVTIYGKDGVELRDVNGQSSIKVKPGSIVLLASGNAVSTGVVTKDCICSYTGGPHPMASINIKASL